MKFRALIFTSATLLAAVPTLSQATAETNALNACSKAFATSIAAPGAPVPTFKLNYHGTGGSAIADFYARGYSFNLNAFDPKTGALMARATCTTGFSGTVIALLANPIDKPTTTLTAQR